MTSIFILPNELIIEILRYLDVTTVHELISQLRHNHSAIPILRLLYQRLFGGVLHIINDEPRLQFRHDYELTIGDFRDKLIGGEEDANFEDLIFQNVRPNIIEFKFTRQQSDYKRFIHDLNQFHQLLESTEPNIRSFFNKTLQINIFIDSNLVFLENPDSFKSIIIKVLLELSKTEFGPKIKNFTIKSSEIGGLYVAHWSQLFKYFTSLKKLNLEDNFLKSNYEQYLDVWGMSQKFPNTLTELNLDKNMLTYISKDFLSNLPLSLEVLSMNQNEINIIEPCELGQSLPNLRHWLLNFTKLCVISPSMFKKCKTGFVLEIKSTYLPDSDLEKLHIIAKDKGLKVLI
ncbi:uncharacterized protein KGF55_000144 [Candida pseudojiufengensis]|uniref:uncharacterized protein n=1 Tax=Candida pseudojiufengensis TaxID=497109 RepID=UPI002224FDBE|nr:uncharacterized protein KGF55_000144 [Candida pseudojiufengensis]KAI5966735.1 hypothetical protein KGF55_000144 [Candida pseudojiufengensis]